MLQTLAHCWPWLVLANAHPEEMHKLEILRGLPQVAANWEQAMVGR